MIANQNSEDDTKGGGAHGPPLSFRESIWGTVAPRVPKHPPLQEAPPKSIYPTPEPILPGTLKMSRRSAGFKSLPQDRIETETADKKSSTQPGNKYTPPERNLQTPCPNHSQWLKAVVRGPPRGGGRAQVPQGSGNMLDNELEMAAGIAIAAEVGHGSACMCCC